MNFQVIWQPEAERQLAALWVDHPANRNAMTVASAEIDRVLEVEADEAGESREHGYRILIVAPLAVTFDVDLERRIVRVGVVRRFGRRQSP